MFARTRSLNEIVDYVDEKGTIEGAPDFKEEHLPVPTKLLLFLSNF